MWRPWDQHPDSAASPPSSQRRDAGGVRDAEGGGGSLHHDARERGQSGDGAGKRGERERMRERERETYGPAAPPSAVGAGDEGDVSAWCSGRGSAVRGGGRGGRSGVLVSTPQVFTIHIYT